MSVLVAILAAGESKRMGKPKLCLRWGDTSILGHILTQWREAGADKILVVHGPGETPVTHELNRLGIPASERTMTVAMEQGMMGSVRTAAKWAVREETVSHLVIAPGDQPHLRTETLRAILEACRTRPDSIIRASFGGKPGHPIALPWSQANNLGASSAETLRDFIGLRQQQVFDLTLTDSGVLLDLDTPEDYARAYE